MQIDYNKLNKKSINVFPEIASPEDIVNMKCGETRGLRLFNDAFILVEKYEGTALKNAIASSLMHKLPFEFKLMIIHRKSSRPMFINRKKEIYFCDNMYKMNQLGHIEDPIYVLGTYDEVIHDTILELSDGSNIRCEYYVFVYTKGNLYDGTRHFMATKHLLDLDQIIIRNMKKRMISTITDTNKHDYKNEIEDMKMLQLCIFIHWFAIVCCILYLIYV